ncbi:MAG: sigma-E processing peptidase SpoIIGA [Bacillota bacterium]
MGSGTPAGKGGELLPAQVVYGDVVLITNFSIDYFLLAVCARFARLRVRHWRLAVAATGGAVYALLAVLGWSDFLYTLPCKLLVSLFMLGLAFWPVPWQRFCRSFVYFYLVSFTLAGLFLAHSFWLEREGFSGLVTRPFVVMQEQAVWAIPLAAALGVMLLRRVPPAWEELCRLEKCTVTVRLGEPLGGVMLSALVDTGNKLVEPVSQCPVLIVACDTVVGRLPVEVAHFCRDVLAGRSTTANAPPGTLLLPFCTVGGQGYLPAVLVQQVEILAGNRSIIRQQVPVALAGSGLVAHCSPAALLPSDLLVETLAKAG